MVTLKQTKHKIAYVGIIVLLSALFSIIYYQIQQGIISSHEEWGAILNDYYVIHADDGSTRRFWTSFFSIIAEFCVRIVGFDYASQWLAWTVVYFLISIVTMDLCMRKTGWDIDIHALPLYIMFMVLMHLSGDYISRYFGDGSFGWKVYTSYPFSLYTPFILMLCILMWTINQLQQIDEKKLSVKWKCVIGCGTGITTIGILGMASFAFYMWAALIPLFFIFLKVKSKKYPHLLYIVLGVFGGFGVALYIIIGREQFLPEWARNYIIRMLHAMHQVNNLYQMKQQVQYYVWCVLANFNADLNSPVLNWNHRVEYFIRINLLIVIYGLWYKNLKLFLGKKDGDYAEMFGALHVAMMTIVFIVTYLGYIDRCRYLAGFIPVGTVVLCWNYRRIMQWLHNKKYYLTWLLLLFVACFSYDSNWNEFYRDPATTKVLAFLEEQELHEGIGIPATALRIQSQSKQERYVFPMIYDEENGIFTPFIQPENITEVDVNQCHFDYFIYYPEERLDNTFDVEQIVDYYGKPDDIVEIFEDWEFKVDTYYILIYKEGIQIE